MGKATEWALWANFMALGSAAMLALGSIIVIIVPFPNHWTGMYGLIVSPIIYIFEWPRGKMKRGRTLPRRYQDKLSFVVSNMGFFGSSYYFRAGMYILFAAPTFFELPTAYAGFFLLCVAFVYTLSAMRGEKWRPIRETRDDTIMMSRPNKLNTVLPFTNKNKKIESFGNNPSATMGMASAGV
eukprot:CFRG8137T1